VEPPHRVLWKIWISFSRGIDIYGQSNKLELLQNLQVVKRMLSRIKICIWARLAPFSRDFSQSAYCDTRFSERLCFLTAYHHFSSI
jgi:hypothetical protein